MEYVYSAMLLHKAGKDVTEDAVKKVLEAAGVEVDTNRVKALIAALDGVDIEEAISKATVAAPAVTPAATGGDAGEAKGESKEESKTEKKDDGQDESEAAAGLGALFG
ncbi:MAG: 50S ribosomal protein P1 [Nanoarchaeota archaeon]